MTMRKLAWVLLSIICLPAIQAQNRLNDKDLEHMMRNLRDDAKSFRSPFTSALKKSTIRKTSQAKNAEHMADSFARETESLLNNFKKTKKGDAHLSGVQDLAQQLGTIVARYRLGPDVSARWQQIDGETRQVLGAYGMASPDYTEDNPQGVSTSPAYGSAACSQAAGPERAARMVDQCLQVSPATHPPCNARNSCSLIIDEIRRGCALLDPRNRPAFCDEYR